MKQDKPVKPDQPVIPRCAAQSYDKTISAEPVRALFNGKRLSKRFTDSVFQNLASTKLYVVTVIHTVAVRSPTTGKMVPVVDEEWIATIVGIANQVWSQACIEIVPYYPGTLITTFKDLALNGGFGECIATGQRELIADYAINVPQTKIINVYLVEDTSGDACGSPLRGEIFMPTTFGTEITGKTFAHELGHLLLNPVGVDNSDNPDHLMFHADMHPGVPAGKNTGLFLSDCLGARATAMEDYFAHNRPGGFDFGNSSEPAKCILNPQLGTNLEVVMIDEAY